MYCIRNACKINYVILSTYYIFIPRCIVFLQKHFYIITIMVERLGYNNFYLWL